MITLTPPARKPAIPADDHLTNVVSASRLNAFHTCRLKFYFRYVMEMVKPATAALFVGKAVHAALQQWSTARWRGQPHDAESLKAGFLMNWITGQEDAPVSWDTGEEDEQQEKAWGLVDMYLRDTPIPSEEKPEAVEVRVEADLAKHGLPSLVGIIDLVRPGGWIVDFKTSAATPNSEHVIHRNETQLTAYGILYREATGKPESGFQLHHLVKTKVPKLVVNEAPATTENQKTKFFRLIESFVDGVEREDYVPSPGLQCAACEFFNECRASTGGNK
ncbi:MAG: PD-(D/E)XK nuclease family protein [Verrucomicrobiae bacterium]